MTVKEYVMKMVNNSAKYRKINVGEEVWNILYGLLHSYGIKHSDKAEDLNEDSKGYIESREEEFIHHYEHIRREIDFDSLKSLIGKKAIIIEENSIHRFKKNDIVTLTNISIERDAYGTIVWYDFKNKYDSNQFLVEREFEFINEELN